MQLKVFLLLIPVVYAKIELHFLVNNENTRVTHVGQNIDVISDKELATFNITDEMIKRVIHDYIGGDPEDVFYHSPTPWNDLYRSFKWEQVTKTITPINATILSVDVGTSIPVSAVFDENNTSIEDFESKIPQMIQNGVSSLWLKPGELSCGLDILYAYIMKARNVVGSSQFIYLWKWGKNMDMKYDFKVGLDSPMNVTLNPNRTVIGEVLLNKAYIRIKVDYEAKLSGNVAVNYGIKKYNDHHFYAMNIIDLMKYTNLPTTVVSSEVIHLEYYYDSTVVFRDVEEGKILYRFPLETI